MLKQWSFLTLWPFGTVPMVTPQPYNYFIATY